MAPSLESTVATRTKFGGVAAVVAAAGIALFGGLWGVAAGVLLVGAWALGGHVYAFALGQVLIVAIWSDPTLLRVTVAQAGLFGLLVAPGLGDVPTRTVGAFVVASAGLIGVVAGVRDVTGHFWVAMVALGATVAICGYTLHRYQLVTLGLVEGDG
jgi:hypothetical protein